MGQEGPPEGVAARVAIVNSSEEIAGLLQAVLQMEGFSTHAAFTLDFKAKGADFQGLVDEFKPHVVVWDIAIPYEENWEFFNRISQAPEFAGIGFVVTTTNKTALEALVGPTPTCEIVGKPFDLQQVLDAIRRTLASG